MGSDLILLGVSSYHVLCSAFVDLLYTIIYFFILFLLFAILLHAFTMNLPRLEKALYIRFC
jgi:hypothetical protein